MQINRINEKMRENKRKTHVNDEQSYNLKKIKILQNNKYRIV